VTVYLLGAGPGDPGLLTVRGASLLARADVVIYDRLSVGGVLDLAPSQATVVNVGKSPGQSRITQNQINDLLVSHGQSGKTVVRLKGGDPFVFARGGEEAAALKSAGVAFEVIPGITSAIAAPAYAGIPVTLRHSSTSVTVVTGHEDPTTPDAVDWDAVARVGGTIVILMGVGRWPQIAARLERGGMAPDTPAAAVRWGTRPNQTTVRATLATLGDHELAAPSTIVVGEVAGENLGWYESKPLFGRRIVVTRTRSQASELSAALLEAGAQPIEVPLIEVLPPRDDGAALAAAAARLGEYDWVVLTSPNGATRLLELLPDARALGGVKVAAIGPGTAAVLAAGNVVADLVPERFVAESLLETFPAGHGKLLLPTAEGARDVLPEGLEAAGWTVHVVVAYRTVSREVSSDERQPVAAADAITFASSSAVTNFVKAFGVEAAPPVVACIGPVTAATARDLGLDVSVAAPVHTIAGLVEALAAHEWDMGPDS
jgi:uroporphyrinogen III methyltransferase/synthase